MGLLRALWRLGRVVAHLLRGLLTMALRFPSLDTTGREAAIQRWSAGLLGALGLSLRVQGQVRPGAVLLVANHVSWLDIAAIHAACGRARFVSKADVQAWPVLGWLIRQAGTLFIERERKRDAMRVVHQVAAALREGQAIAVFPEGTTGPGPTLLPFHANLLQAAIAVAVPVQPVALRYAAPGQPYAEAACYIGDTTLGQSLWRIASARDLCVDVHFLLSQDTAHADRRALAAALRAQIQDGVTRLGEGAAGGAV